MVYSNSDKRSYVNSVSDYNNLIKPVSHIILKVTNDFNITMKNEITEEFKNAIRNILGQGF